MYAEEEFHRIIQPLNNTTFTESEVHSDEKSEDNSCDIKSLFVVHSIPKD